MLLGYSGGSTVVTATVMSDSFLFHYFGPGMSDTQEGDSSGTFDVIR